MSDGGIIWGTILSIPFWILVIWLIKAGVKALHSPIFVGLGLTIFGLLLFVILKLTFKAKQEKKGRDIFFKNISTAPTQSKPHPKDSSESSTAA